MVTSFGRTSIRVPCSSDPIRSQVWTIVVPVHLVHRGMVDSKLGVGTSRRYWSDPTLTLVLSQERLESQMHAELRFRGRCQLQARSLVKVSLTRAASKNDDCNSSWFCRPSAVFQLVCIAPPISDKKFGAGKEGFGGRRLSRKFLRQRPGRCPPSHRRLVHLSGRLLKIAVRRDEPPQIDTIVDAIDPHGRRSSAHDDSPVLIPQLVCDSNIIGPNHHVNPGCADCMAWFCSPWPTRRS